MGGASAGEVASRLALSVGTRLALESTWTFSKDEDDVRAIVNRAAFHFREIDRAVKERAHAD